jgi:hypothetical protein
MQEMGAAARSTQDVSSAPTACCSGCIMHAMIAAFAKVVDCNTTAATEDTGYHVHC